LKKVVRIFNSFKEAEAYDIQQQISMTPAERLAAAAELKKRVYGTKTIDVKIMAPKKITTAHFSRDTQEFLVLLDKHRVKYLIVAGAAVIYYGHIRLTGDIDFFYGSDEKNTKQLYQVLQEFWSGDIPGIKSEQDLRRTGMIFQFGVPPNRIDLINLADGLVFEEAWDEREDISLTVDRQQITVHYICIEALIRNKKKINRPRDQEDLRFLEAMLKKRDEK